VKVSDGHFLNHPVRQQNHFVFLSNEEQVLREMQAFCVRGGSFQEAWINRSRVVAEHDTQPAA
jgi:hypothetical protein